MATFTGDGSVQLRYDDAIVFETSTGGIDIPDDKKLQFGAGQDLQIYHDSSNNVSFISESGTADLHIKGGNIVLKSHIDNDDYIKCIENGAVELYYDNTKMFSTTTNGCQVEADRRFEIVNGSNWSGEQPGKIEHHSSNMYHQFQTNWIVRNSSGTDVLNVDGSGNVTANGNVTAYSDIRVKEDVKTIDNALDKISKLRGVEYTRKETKEREIGVIAQEVKEIVPELVTVENLKSDINPDALEDMHTMKYGNTVGLLIEAIKELKSDLDNHKQHCTCGGGQ